MVNAESEAARWTAEAAQARTEKECLASEVAQLKAVYEQLLCDTQEEQLERALESTTVEAEDMRAQ